MGAEADFAPDISRAVLRTVRSKGVLGYGKSRENSQHW